MKSHQPVSGWEQYYRLLFLHGSSSSYE